MGTFRLMFFAKLREDTQTESMEIPLADVQNLDKLIPYLVERFPHWSVYLHARIMTAVNQTMTSKDVSLCDGDEVALFPPVTGG